MASPLCYLHAAKMGYEKCFCNWRMSACRVGLSRIINTHDCQHMKDITNVCLNFSPVYTNSSQWCVYSPRYFHPSTLMSLLHQYTSLYFFCIIHNDVLQSICSLVLSSTMTCLQSVYSLIYHPQWCVYNLYVLWCHHSHWCLLFIYCHHQ